MTAHLMQSDRVVLQIQAELEPPPPTSRARYRGQSTAAWTPKTSSRRQYSNGTGSAARGVGQGRSSSTWSA